MGLGDEGSIDRFSMIYWGNLKKCKGVDMEFLGENLRSLAKECHLALKKLLDHPDLTEV